MIGDGKIGLEEFPHVLKRGMIKLPSMREYKLGTLNRYLNLKDEVTKF